VTAASNDHLPAEDPSCEWARAKERIREQIGAVPFSNWFERTRQLTLRNGVISIAVPDEASVVFIEAEHREDRKGCENE
jgi:hypothetical protein